MGKQIKALIAAGAAFGSVLVSVVVGTGGAPDLEQSGVALMIAFTTWLFTWLSPKNAS